MTFTELKAVELTSSDRDWGTQYNSTIVLTSHNSYYDSRKGDN